MFDLLTLKAKLIAMGVSFLVGCTVAGTAAYKLHNLTVTSLRVEWENEKAKAVGAVRDEEKAICSDNNKITKENAHALQAKYDIINRNYDSLLKYTAPSGAGKNGLASPAGRNDGAPGANVPTLCVSVFDLAAAGKLNDKQAAALITLQDVVAAIYIANGRADLLPAEYIKSK